MKRFFKLFIVCFFIFCCYENRKALPYYNSPDFTAIFEEPKPGSHKIKKFVFTNQDEEAFGSKDLKGKIHVANFMFTSCLLYTSPSPRDRTRSRMPSSA